MEGKSSTFFPPHSTETMKQQISQHFPGKGEKPLWTRGSALGFLEGGSKFDSSHTNAQPES